MLEGRQMVQKERQLQMGRDDLLDQARALSSVAMKGFFIANS